MLGEQLEVVDRSAVYETAAWGHTAQPDFYNVALMVQTTLHPFALLDYCQAVEASIGRAKTEYWGPRRIDIDILYIDDLIIHTQRLTLPHPRLHIRNFVLYPLNDVDGLFMHPIFGRSCADLLSDCVDTTIVRRIDEAL
jgi:2-amino-4-hydroxy-6-hydroxymethyldihydropteridine diphosphokinase